MMFQLDLYLHDEDSSRVDRSKLQSLGLLIAKDWHLFKGPSTMDRASHPVDYYPQNVLAHVFRRMENQHLEELLFGRLICSKRYREAREALFRELSNLIRMVLSFTVCRQGLSVSLQQYSDKLDHHSIGYLFSCTKGQVPKPLLKIQESHLLLRQPEKMMEETNHVHHFVTNFAALLTTDILRAALDRINFERPYCLCKNLTGKLMLVAMDTLDKYNINYVKTMFMLKSKKVSNQFQSEIQ